MRWLKTKTEHRDLDVTINHLMSSRHHDNMRIKG